MEASQELYSLLADKERLIDSITKLLGDLLAETREIPR